VGQIYLYDNPLLKQPLTKEHIKPRLLGHWGTTPGLNFIYVHLNRLIKKHDLDMIYITGPGHGGPGLVANAYLEGTYSEVYPNISSDEEGMKRLFTQFSFPGGIPSHVAPETPGSIHEGGELGRGKCRRSHTVSTMSASLIGRLGQALSGYPLLPVSMSLTGSRFSSDSAPRPFHHGIRR
jgi:phosphoketolase